MSDTSADGHGRWSARPDTLWRWVALTLVGAGALGAVLALRPAVLLVVTGVSGVLVVAARSTGTGERLVPGRGAGQALRQVGLGTAVLVAAVGVLSGTGGWGLLLWAGLLGACWCGLGRVSMGPAAPSTAGSPTPVAGDQAAVDEAGGLVATAEDPGRLSDEDLRRRWRSSYLQVRGATDPSAVGRLARTRQAYLDELQRRHPREFEAWLGSASNAARYLAGDVASVTRADDGWPWPSALQDRDPESDAA